MNAEAVAKNAIELRAELLTRDDGRRGRLARMKFLGPAGWVGPEPGNADGDPRRVDVLGRGR